MRELPGMQQRPPAFLMNGVGVTMLPPSSFFLCARSGRFPLPTLLIRDEWDFSDGIRKKKKNGFRNR